MRIRLAQEQEVGSLMRWVERALSTLVALHDVAQKCIARD